MIFIVIRLVLVLLMLGIFWTIFWPRGWDAYDKRIGNDMDAGSEHRDRHPKTGRPRD